MKWKIETITSHNAQWILKSSTENDMTGSSNTSGRRASLVTLEVPVRGSDSKLLLWRC